MISVAPRIVNDVSFVTRINHDSHFAWQGQYLVKLQVSLFVAGAAFGEIWTDSRSAKFVVRSITSYYCVVVQSNTL